MTGHKTDDGAAAGIAKVSQNKIHSIIKLVYYTNLNLRERGLKATHAGDIGLKHDPFAIVHRYDHTF